MILVDLNYWETNRGRLYTDVLQDPLEARARLPRQEDPENRKPREGIDRVQQELREAVAGSKRLQEEAARRGRKWLRKYVSVHLNVMNPADVFEGGGALRGGGGWGSNTPRPRGRTARSASAAPRPRP
jgi:hypothetical protein